MLRKKSTFTKNSFLGNYSIISRYFEKLCSLLIISKKQRKKGIIAVGKMGMGKSSFIRMLVTSELAGSIRVGGGVENCTC